MNNLTSVKNIKLKVKPLLQKITDLYKTILGKIKDLLKKIKPYINKVQNIINKLPFNGLCEKASAKVPFLKKISSMANYLFCILVFILLLVIVTPSGSSKNPVAGRKWTSDIETFGTIVLKKNNTFHCKSDILDVSKGEYNFDTKSGEIELYDRVNSKFLKLYYNEKNKTIEYRVLGIKVAQFKK